MIGIIDYGMGNLASLENAFDYLGLDSEIAKFPEKIFKYDRVILPGVGSFNSAMKTITSEGWREVLINYASSKKPILGICLGMQILFTVGHEHGTTDGLNLISGEVQRLKSINGQKIPHVGWNCLHGLSKHPLLENYKDGVDLYFVHSYHVVPDNEDYNIAKCSAGDDFIAVVARENIAGMQFHPEKSQPYGLKILENFSAWEPIC